MSLVHTIILPLIVIYNNITTAGVFVGTFYWTLQPLFLSCAVWSSVRFCSCASARLIPTSWLFSIAAFRSAVQDMIGISRDTFGKMKGGARKQATLIQNEAIVCRSWFSCAILPKCVSPPFFYAIRCLLKKTIMNLAQTEETVASLFPWQSARRK